MQKTVAEFESRGVKLVLVSVDPPEVGRKWADEKGFTFTILSDPQMVSVDTWGVRNPDVEELALHAAFLVNAQGEITYRKIARRRVKPDELLHAIDGDEVVCCAGSCPKGEAVCRAKP